MLKPADPGPEDDRSIGELLRELVDDGKTYATAEIELAKAIVIAKCKALILPTALFAIALILALAAVTALAVGAVIALAKFIGPLLAGIAGMIIFAGIAAGLGWYGAERVKRIL